MKPTEHAAGEPPQLPALIEASHLAKRFGEQASGRFDYLGRALRRLGWSEPAPVTHAVDGVDLQIRRGEVVGLVGESGCGKSTLGRMVAGLLPPSAGEIRVDGQAVEGLDASARRALRLKIQMVFQDPYASLNPRLRVDRIVGEGARLHGLVDAAGFDDYVSAQLERAGWIRPCASATRTSSAAASASASALPARWPCSRSCWCATRPSPRWTFPSRRRCSTCSWTCASNSA